MRVVGYVPPDINAVMNDTSLAEDDICNSKTCFKSECVGEVLWGFSRNDGQTHQRRETFHHAATLTTQQKNEDINNNKDIKEEEIIIIVFDVCVVATNNNNK